MKSAAAPDLDMNALPGYHIRRLQQIAVAIFLQETEEFGLTPIQYAALAGVRNAPGIDQRSLARAIGLDTSTTGGVIERLASRGLLVRSTTAEDRRVRLLTLSDEGRALLDAVTPSVLTAQKRILEPLSRAERQAFVRMLRTLVTANNEASRAPSEA